MTPGFLAWGQYGQSPPLTEWRFLRESSGPWDRIPPSWVRGSSLRMEPWSGQGSWSLASKWTTHQGWLGDHSSVPPPSGGRGGQAPVNPLGPAIRDQPVRHSVHSRLSNRLASWGRFLPPFPNQPHQWEPQGQGHLLVGRRGHPILQGSPCTQLTKATVPFQPYTWYRDFGKILEFIF